MPPRNDRFIGNEAAIKRSSYVNDADTELRVRYKWTSFTLMETYVIVRSPTWNLYVRIVNECSDR